MHLKSHRNVMSEPVDWLWTGRIALGNYRAIVDGDRDPEKACLTLDVCVRLCDRVCSLFLDLTCFSAAAYPQVPYRPPRRGWPPRPPPQARQPSSGQIPPRIPEQISRRSAARIKDRAQWQRRANDRHYFPRIKSTTQHPRTCGPGPRQWDRMSALSQLASSSAPASVGILSNARSL
jgi:hypothetical protein